MRWRERLSRPRLALILCAMFLVSHGLMAWLLYPITGDEVFDLQTTFSAEHFDALVARWRMAGALDGFWHHLVVDMLHPLWYGGFLAALIARGLVATKAHARADLALLVPAAAGVLDVVENTGHGLALSTTGSRHALFVALAGAGGTAKWSLIGFSVVLVIALWLRRGREDPPAAPDASGL